MSRIQRPLRPAYVFSMWCDDHDDPALICHVTTRMWNDVNKQNNGKQSVPQTQNAVFWVFFSRVPLRRKMHSLSAAVVICLCTVSASVLADESSNNNTTTKTTTTTTTTQKTTLTSTTENVEDGLFLIVFLSFDNIILCYYWWKNNSNHYCFTAITSNPVQCEQTGNGIPLCQCR